MPNRRRSVKDRTIIRRGSTAPRPVLASRKRARQAPSSNAPPETPAEPDPRRQNPLPHAKSRHIRAFPGMTPGTRKKKTMITFGKFAENPVSLGSLDERITIQGAQPYTPPLHRPFPPSHFPTFPRVTRQCPLRRCSRSAASLLHDRQPLVRQLEDQERHRRPVRRPHVIAVPRTVVRALALQQRLADARVIVIPLVAA